LVGVGSATGSVVLLICLLSMVAYAYATCEARSLDDALALESLTIS
jgi:cbb3-type cytochrome oxidase subunit 3